MPPLKTHWVCFTCRKQVRIQPSLAELRSASLEADAVERDCPVCRGPMVDMGSYFRPPRRRNLRDWEQLRVMAEHGIRFFSEGSIAWQRYVMDHTNGRLDARARIAYCPCHTRTDGQKLLSAITQRTGRWRIRVRRRQA